MAAGGGGDGGWWGMKINTEQSSDKRGSLTHVNLHHFWHLGCGLHFAKLHVRQTQVTGHVAVRPIRTNVFPQAGLVELNKTNVFPFLARFADILSHQNTNVADQQSGRDAALDAHAQINAGDAPVGGDAVDRGRPGLQAQQQAGQHVHVVMHWPPMDPAALRTESQARKAQVGWRVIAAKWIGVGVPELLLHLASIVKAGAANAVARVGQLHLIKECLAAGADYNTEHGVAIINFAPGPALRCAAAAIVDLRWLQHQSVKGDVGKAQLAQWRRGHKAVGHVWILLCIRLDEMIEFQATLQVATVLVQLKACGGVVR